MKLERGTVTEISFTPDRDCLFGRVELQFDAPELGEDFGHVIVARVRIKAKEAQSLVEAEAAILDAAKKVLSHSIEALVGATPQSLHELSVASEREKAQAIQREMDQNINIAFASTN
ncbi:hypothetical protein NKH91_29630 [Mesorhizobium sp. M0894]|uniref:hypothetical protein n=1 Tax=unclassified Mesorhizobium TaxID=325217 RepID=UPI00333C45B8